MNEASEQKWYIMFNGRRTNVYDQECLGRTSIVNDKMKSRIEEKIKEERRFTINGLNAKC